MEKVTERYRVMIVDDEAILRTGIMHLCNWDDYNIEIVAQAANGEEALQDMEKARPHVVITDIVMPVMDGVEFTKTMRKQYPEVKLIVLSSYSEFDYVREVFKYGVTDYLLKPKVSAPELISLIQSVCGDMDLVGRKEVHTVEEDPSLQLGKLLGSEERVSDDNWKLLQPYFRNTHYRLVKATTAQLLSRTNWTQGELEQRMMDLASKHMEGFDYACVFLKNECLLLMNYKLDDVVQAITSIRQLTLEARTIFSSIVFVLSGAFDQLEQAWPTNHRLTQCLGKLFYFPDQHCIPETKIRLDSDQVAFDHAQFTSFLRTAAIDKAVEQLKALIVQIRAIQAFDEYSLKRFCQNIVYTALSSVEHMKLPLTERGSSKLRLFKMIDQALDIHELEVALVQFFAELEQEVAQHMNQQQSFILNQIYEYVNDNYANEITLSDIAEQLHLNYSYLSTYFKQRTNENLTAFINRVRVEKAKELLSNQKLTISQISRLTGFSEHNYFSKVFKKLTGMTPVEYRNQISQ